MIIIATENINRSGFRLLVSGINLDFYKKNPIVLAFHGRASKYHDKDSVRLPVARLENVRVLNNQLVADDPIWDEKDEFALTLKNKFEGGFLNAFSPGLTPLTISDDQQYLLQGQSRPTIVTSEMFEVSIADIPRDGNAVRLDYGGDQTIDDLLPEIEINSKSKNIEMDFKNIAIELGLPESATEADVMTAIGNIKSTAATARKGQIEVLMSQAETKGLVNDDNRAAMENFAKKDFDGFKKVVENTADLKPKEEKEDKEEITLKKILELAKGDGGQKKKGGKEEWDFDEWSKKDPKGLLLMKQNEEDKYNELAKTYAES